MRRWILAICASLVGLPAAGEEPPVYVRHWGRTGQLPGYFTVPAGVACDSAGNIYVVEIGNQRVQKFAPSGERTAAWDGFRHPSDVALDDHGHVWVADRGNHRIECFTTDGVWLSSFGNRGRAPGQFTSPAGLAVHGDRAYVADTYNNRICILTIDGSTLAFETAFGDSGSAPGQLFWPQDVAVASDGSIVVTDTENNRVQRYDAAGTFLTRIGGVTRFSWPYGVAIDGFGNVYVSEPYRSQVLKLTLEGRYILTWGTVGPKVQKLQRPLRMAFDPQGLLLVADHDDTGHSDRLVFWRPSEVPTAVEPKSWTDVRRAFR